MLIKSAQHSYELFKSQGSKVKEVTTSSHMMNAALWGSWDLDCFKTVHPLTSSAYQGLIGAEPK